MKRFLALILSALLIISTFSITVSAASVINYNFDNLADGDYMQADMSSQFGFSFASDSAFTFSSSGGKLTANTVGKETDSYSLTLDKVFTSGVLEYKSRFKIDENNASSGGYNHFAISVSDENGHSVELLRANSGNGGFARPQGNSDNHGWVGPTLKVDDEGFYNVSITITDKVPANYSGQNFYVCVNDLNAGGAKKSSHTVKVLDKIAKLSFSASKNSASKSFDTKVTFDNLAFKEFKPEVIAVSAPEGNVSPKIGAIVIAFNTAVNPSTVADGIIFEKVSGETAKGLTITPSDDKKSVTLNFDALDITDYRLSVTDRLKDADGASFVPYFVNYTAVVEPLEISNISNAGGTVLPSIGTIEVTFNNPIDETTLADGVTFLKENGKPIPGGAVVRMGDESDKIQILVGRVLKGSYVLTLNQNLKDSYGDSLDEIQTYGYIVEESNPAMVDVDYTDLEQREYMHSEIEAISGAVFPTSSKYMLNGVDGGLEVVKPSGIGNDGFKIYNADVFNTGELTYNIIIKNVQKNSAGSGVHSFRANLFDSNGKSVLITSGFMSNGLERPTGLNGNYSGHDGSNKIAAVADDDGFLNLNIVITDDIPTAHLPSDNDRNPSKFVMYIYDNNNKGNLIYRQSIYEKLLSDVEGISFSNYSDGANQPYERAVIIKKVLGTLNEAKIPNSVMSSDAEGISPSAGNVEFIFSNSFKNVTADGISVVCGDKIIDFTTDVLEDEKTITISPVDYFKYGETYTISFPAPLQTFEFTTENYPDRLSASVIGMLLETHIVNNEADEYLIVASYKDEDGNEVSVKSARTSGVSASIPIPTDAESVTINAYRVVDGCYIKASLPFERSL